MASDQQFCLRWNNHQNTLVSIFDSLLESGTLVDCTLAAEGRFLQAHKVVLSACSPYFAMLLKEHYDKFPILILKDIKYQELQAMMNYMYRGEVNITQETLGSFLKAAESLQIRGLTDNSNCVENNNGIVREHNSTHPYQVKKLPESRKIVSATPLVSQQRSRSPPTMVSQTSKKYLKSSVVENHQNSNSKSIDSVENSSPSIKRKKLLPPIKSEGLVVTPINPSTSTYNNLDVSNVCEVPSQAQSIPAVEGKANVPLPSIPPKIESPHMDITPVISSKVPLPCGINSDALIKTAKQIVEMVKVKNEQLEDSYNEDTNDDSYTTEDIDNERDENSHIPMGMFHNNQSLTNFENATDRSLMSQDGNNSLQDSSAFAVNPYGWLNNWELNSKYVRLTETNPFNCQHCGKRYRWKSTLKRHESFECGGKEPAHKCPHCDYRAKQSGNLRVHIRKYHTDRTSITSPGVSSLPASVPVVNDLLPAASSGSESDFSDEDDYKQRRHSKRRFSPYQVETLKKEFAKSPYITQSQAAVIARETGLQKLQVRKWFSDHRCKIKKRTVGIENESADFDGKDEQSSEQHSMENGEEEENNEGEETDDGDAQVSEDDSISYRSVVNKYIRRKRKGEDNSKKEIKIPVNVPKEVTPKLKKILDENDEFTLAEIYQHAANLKISNVECRNWLLLHGARIKAVISSKIIAGKPRCRFFDELPYETKIALLKKTRHIGNVRVMTATMIQELADELYLPLIPLKNWLRNKRRRDQTCVRQLSKEVVESLKKEFEKCNYLDEDQALFLAYELNSPSTLIKKWFINQRFQEQKSQVEKIKSDKVKRFARKTVEQKNILFEVFKNSPNYIGQDRMRDVEKMTNLNSRQIGKWLSCIRVKWSKCTKSQLKKDLTKNLSKELLLTFENEYKKNRFLVDEAELMKRTGKSIFVLRNWFSKRRLYELRSGGLSLVEEFNNAAKSNEVEENEMKSKTSAETKSVANDDIEFFKKLPHSCKVRLFKACKDDNPSYEQLSQDIGVSVSVIKEWIANRKQNDDLKDEQNEDEQVPIEVPLAHEPALNLKRLFAQKNILFEEFKKQPKLSLSKVKSLANRLHLTTLQVRKWFYNYQKMFSKHSKERVLATVKDSNFPSDVILKLEEHYRKNRFISDLESEEMAERFGVTRGQVKNWFVFARYFEILTGYAPNSKPTSLNSFLNKLEPGKQKRLIDELKHYPFGQEKILALSEELNLSVDDLQNWFEKSLSSNLTIKQKMAKSNRMNFPKIQALKYEFLKNPDLSLERARALSMRYKINKDRLREWFERRKTIETVGKQVQPEERKTEEPVPNAIEMQMKTLKTPVISVSKTSPSDFISSSNEKRNYKMPLQQNQLFDEFKLSPYLSNERLLKLINQTGLLGKQINAWFQWMRVKLAGIDRDTLKEENRNQNLSIGLIAILEQEYAKNRYLSTEAREKLATQLNLSKGLLKTWFAKRRYYEILGEPSTDERERCSIPSEIENIQIDDDAMEVDRVETVIIYDWEAEDETDDLETQENQILIGIDESGDSKINFDPSILIAQAPTIEEKRSRVFTPLDADLEPVDKDIDNLFWFLRKNPKDKQPAANETIDAEKDAYLEKELEKNPWKTMDEIAELSTRLNVSETMIHWWFIKKRCLLTKTVLTFKIEPPKSFAESSSIVDITDEDTIDQIFNEPEKLNAHDFEFVALNENEIKQENFVDESDLENQMMENEVDPMLVCQVVKSPVIQEEWKNVPALKKKKKKVPLTSHQRSILMQEFKRCKYISGTKARMLANDLGLSMNRVDMWFENMRKSSEKKSNETSNSKDKSEKLTSLIIETLETEFQKSSNFSEKRIKQIAYKLNISIKLVRRWIFQKIKSGSNADVEK